ncbi:MAG: hypothetical protein JXB04_04300 [Kiritimatiellae bacterium]|nr:hypothetical protein [Kiritimatiellia bacterium]
MARKRKGAVKTDFSSFMPIIIMTTGCLVTLLVTNTLIIVSNPENVRITSVIRSALYVEGSEGLEGGAPFPFGNRNKDPSYVDVYRDRVVVYPGAKVVPVRDLEIPGNAFEHLLNGLEQKKEDEYIILLVRPRAALVARRLRKAINARDVDIGYELFEENRPVEYDRAARSVAGEAQ